MIYIINNSSTQAGHAIYMNKCCEVNIIQCLNRRPQLGRHSLATTMQLVAFTCWETRIQIFFGHFTASTGILLRHVGHCLHSRPHSGYSATRPQMSTLYVKIALLWQMPREAPKSNLKRNNTADTPPVILISFTTDMFKKHFRKTVDYQCMVVESPGCWIGEGMTQLRECTYCLQKNVAKWITLQTCACITCGGLLAQWAYRAA